MRIQLPFCTPFDIVGHRPGEPVDDIASRGETTRALRDYLPIKLRREVRPVWAREENSGSSTSPVNLSEAPAGTVTGENTTSPAPERAAEGVPLSSTSVDVESASAEGLSPELQALAAWAIDAAPIERSQRIALATKFARCWESSGTAEIVIQNEAHLTSLPPIPPNVTKLEVTLCSNLLVPPAMLEGSQMQSLSLHACGNLSQGPDVSRCAQLKDLTLQDCDRISVPPTISNGQHITDLNFSGCTQLATLPDLAHCPQLSVLNLTDCRALTGSLDLSSCPHLQTLFMSGCSGINELALSHCDQLASIFMSDCSSLTTLPSVGHLQRLDFLDLDGTPLTSLPEDIVRLPQSSEITLNATGLSDAVRNRLHHIMNAADYTGPNILYSMHEPTPALVIRPLNEEAAEWHAEAPEHLRAALSGFDWSALPSQNTATAFSNFLARIRETSDYRHANGALKTVTQERVTKLLAQLQSDPALRENCCNLALDAVNTCGDRVALRLMDMENLALISTASAAIDAGKYDNNPQALVDLCKGQHRLALVSAAANDKVASMHFTDPIEVHLGYITKLVNSCVLPVQISTMLYPRCSGVTDDDLAAIRKKLANTGLSEAECVANNRAYHSALAGSDLMRKLLHRLRPADMRAANSNNDVLISQEQERLYAQMESLPPGAANYGQQSLQLKKMFNALKTDIPAQATLPLLLDFMVVNGIDSGLSDAAGHHLSEAA